MQRGLSKPGPADTFFQFSILLLVATGYAAVLATGRLDRVAAVLAGIALAIRPLIARRWIRLPLSAAGVRILTLLYLAFYPIDLVYLSQSFFGATVQMVFFLAAIKLLTAQTGRDYLYLGVIALLELLSAAMLTSSPSFLVFLVLFLLFAVAARASYEITSGCARATQRAPAARMGLRLAGLSLALGFAIAILSGALFLVVPRAAGAYLSGLPASGESVLGFSEEVSLGNIGQVTRSDAPVLRVKILEGRPGRDPKWRGAALRSFDGIRWSNPPSKPETLLSSQGQYVIARSRPRRRQGPRVEYRVSRAPMETEALFLADIPERVSGEFTRLEVSDTDTISLSGSRWRPVAYIGGSVVEPERSAELRTLMGDADYPQRVPFLFLQLPRLDPRIPRLARHLTESQVSPYWRAAAIEHYLRTEFGYTLELPSERVPDPLANFLFRRKKGHCEYFASAMAVMLRSIGIPSRVVTGFQTGVYNPMSDSYTVRASDAHAWVEAYISGYGWVTFDPTPAGPRVAPGGTLHQLWLLRDAMETYWNEWVIQYDAGRQVLLARTFQNQWFKTAYSTLSWWDKGRAWVESNWRTLKQEPRALFWLVTGLLAAMAAAGGSVWAWPRVAAWLAGRRVARGRPNANDCALLYARALERMRRRGFTRQPWQTPGEFAVTIQPPERRAHLALLTTVYNRARYGHDPEAARELSSLVRSLDQRPW